MTYTRKSMRHSEEWWATAPPGVFRCQGSVRAGTQCQRESEAGAAVCNMHGGAALQVQRRAAERMRMAADQMLDRLMKMVDDPLVADGVRAKIAQDLLDRAGLAATQVHKVVPATEDPVEALFKTLLADPQGLAEHHQLESGVVVQGEVVDAAQEAIDRLEESWIPDAEVRPLRPADFGKQGPHQMSRPNPPKHIREGLGL